jgi:IclR helix-turn-helix domain./Alkylmercury lyase.
VRPLLPSLDAAGAVRETAFALIYRDRRPIGVADIAGAADIDASVVDRAVTTLAREGWLDRDAEGRITGAAGLSLTTGPHSLVLGDAVFRTWCAYDGLGIAAALSVDALVETTCAQCQTPIHLTFHAGIPERAGPERLWLAEGGADLRGSFCIPTVLLCGTEHGQAWADRQGGRGHLLDLVEGALQGAADWAGCANAARRLS